LLKELKNGAYLIINEKEKRFYWGCSRNLPQRLQNKFRNVIHGRRIRPGRVEVMERVFLGSDKSYYKDFKVFVFSKTTKRADGYSSNTDLFYVEYVASLYCWRELELKGYRPYNRRAPYGPCYRLDLTSGKATVYKSVTKAAEETGLTVRQIEYSYRGGVSNCCGNTLFYWPFPVNTYVSSLPFHEWKVLRVLKKDNSTTYHTTVKEVVKAYNVSAAVVYKSLRYKVWISKKRLYVERCLLIICCGLTITIKI